MRRNKIYTVSDVTSKKLLGFREERITNLFLFIRNTKEERGEGKRKVEVTGKRIERHGPN